MHVGRLQNSAARCGGLLAESGSREPVNVYPGEEGVAIVVKGRELAIR